MRPWPNSWHHGIISLGHLYLSISPLSAKQTKVIIFRDDGTLISHRELKEGSAVVQAHLFTFCAVTQIAPFGLTSLPCKQLAVIKHSLLEKKSLYNLGESIKNGPAAVTSKSSWSLCQALDKVSACHPYLPLKASGSLHICSLSNLAGAWRWSWQLRASHGPLTASSPDHSAIQDRTGFCSPSDFVKSQVSSLLTFWCSNSSRKEPFCIPS